MANFDHPLVVPFRSDFEPNVGDLQPDLADIVQARSMRGGPELGLLWLELPTLHEIGQTTTQFTKFGQLLSHFGRYRPKLDKIRPDRTVISPTSNEFCRCRSNLGLKLAKSG